MEDTKWGNPMGSLAVVADDGRDGAAVNLVAFCR
jgi:hypothetical protein